jgi:hypothetical protein
MITVRMICYVGFVYAALKVINTRVSPISVAVSARIGMFMLGGALIGWKQAAPMPQQMFLRLPLLEI